MLINILSNLNFPTEIAVIGTCVRKTDRVEQKPSRTEFSSGHSMPLDLIK